MYIYNNRYIIFKTLISLAGWIWPAGRRLETPGLGT